VLVVVVVLVSHLRQLVDLAVEAMEQPLLVHQQLLVA